MYLLLGYGIANKSVSKYFDKKKINYLIYDDDTHKLQFDFNKIECIIKSGGIKNDHFIIKKAKKLKILIISDIELFYLLNKSKKIIAVSGSNGKSTVCSLVKHIIDDIDLAGNIGVGVFDYINSKKDIIIEVSSYMGEYLIQFKPFIGCLINIYPNHLDYHLTYENYYNSKINIFKNMDRPLITNLVINKLKTKSYQNISFDTDNEYLKMYPDNLKCAILICLEYGIKMDIIKERLKSFVGLNHRVEFFLNYQNILFFNDSKSTNIISLNNALNHFKNKKTLLVMGGKSNKNNDYNTINIKEDDVIFLNGESRIELYQALKSKNKFLYIYETLNETIENIYLYLQNKQDIEVVLFSFGHQSYDQFNNFMERGQFLKTKVLELFS